MKSIDGIKRIIKAKAKKKTARPRVLSFARKSAKVMSAAVLSLILILSQSSVFSAFEVHVINVTAKIENRIPPPPPPPEEHGRRLPLIADACVTQAKCTSGENNGARRAMKIISKKNGNARAFVRFDFHFPPGTTVQSALLKLFMFKAPGASRQYEAKRVLEEWKERDPNGVTWKNQPDIDTEILSMTLSGTTPGWLSWDVGSSTQDFVNGLYPNYGWRLGDSQEDSLTRYLAKFRSRESNKAAQRPVLEIAFTSPAAATAYPVINEVYSDTGDGKGQERKNEWVEIYNPTGSAVNISGWKICADGGCDVIPSSSPVPSHGFAVVSPEGATWGFWPGIPAGAIKIVLGSKFGSNGLDNSGGRVILKNASGATIDAMSYGNDESQLDPSIHASGEGNSMARIVKGYDTNSAFDWITNVAPNPGENPSSGGAEVIRFTADGVEVAGLERGLEPLADSVDYEDEETDAIEKEEYIEPATEPVLESATSSTANETETPVLETRTPTPESVEGETNTEPTPTPSVKNSQTLGVENNPTPAAETENSAQEITEEPVNEPTDNETTVDTEETLAEPPGETPEISEEINNNEEVEEITDTEEIPLEQNNETLETDLETNNNEESVSPATEVIAPEQTSADQETPAEPIPTPSVSAAADQTLGVGDSGNDSGASAEAQPESAAIIENNETAPEAPPQENSGQ